MRWHDSANIRKRGGDAAESGFAAQVRCHCGGQFNFIGNLRAGFPDFACDNCEQLVDVKSSPQAERTGNLAVSAIPWSHYPDDMLLAAFIGGRWIGEYKRDIQPSNQKPYEPTHRDRPTRYHLISWRGFRSLSELGYDTGLL